ncbi:MAG: sugar phosphate nucleotidyltransferase [Bacteroidales bacterium]|nr:sugar phosphate nucleotidyltransferase [Bacteroidales bacterium]
MNPTLLILAAGIGSRFGGLKQAEGVGPSGEAILDYSIYDAIRAGFKKVVFVIRKDIYQDMKRIFFDKWSDKIEIDHVFQEVSDLPAGFQAPADRTKPWGTGHAIWVAGEKIREPFCVINADDFYGRKSYELAAAFLSNMDNLLHSRYALIGYILKNTLSEHGYVSRAECETNENGTLRRITERLKIIREGKTVLFMDEDGKSREIDENAVVSMNIWGFMPSLFHYLEKDLVQFLTENASSTKAEFLLPNVIDRLIISGEVEVPVLPTEAKWFGMTYQEDRELVRAKLAELVVNGEYPARVWGSSGH